MNLIQIRDWAVRIELSKVPEKKRHHAKCYKEMIIEAIAAINDSTHKVEKYTEDVLEYLKQLEKIGLVLPSGQVSAPKEEPKKEPFKSTLIP